MSAEEDLAAARRAAILAALDGDAKAAAIYTAIGQSVQAGMSQSTTGDEDE